MAEQQRQRQEYECLSWNVLCRDRNVCTIPSCYLASRSPASLVAGFEARAQRKDEAYRDGAHDQHPASASAFVLAARARLPAAVAAASARAASSTLTLLHAHSLLRENALKAALREDPT